MDRQAIIDMGSNSFRLVVYGYEPERWWALIDEIREAVRVSEGMRESGRLQPEPMNRALHTAAVFAAFCRSAKVEKVDAIATSAIREAENRDELLEEVRRRAGLEVRVISGEEEARLGYLAIANSTTLADGHGVEIGGGSAQLTALEGRRLRDSISLPLGAVRVSEAFLPGDDAPGKAQKALRRHVEEQLEQAPWWPDGEGARLVGIGGTIRNLAAAAQKTLDMPDIDVGGFELSAEMLAELIDELASHPAPDRGSISGIKPDRGDVILGGALVLATFMERGGFEAVEVSEAGMREGAFFEKLLQGRDPPLFDDVRRASVVNLAHRFRTDDAHVDHVARLSLEMYDGLADAGLHQYGDEERELLWAACMLHDIGVAIDYDDHHRHSHYVILNSGLPGFSSRELVLIALIARYHRKGEPDASSLGDLAVRGDKARLRLLTGVIRLAEQLERSRDQIVAGVEVVVDNGAVRLATRTEGGDPSVPLWAARRNSDVLADAVGQPVEIA
jgi:exopolyphosphatase / guanosine-5'-triphosphate,3'-diphosphate pyrophosphatase